MSEIDPLTRALVCLRNHLSLAAEEIDTIIKERIPPTLKEPTRDLERTAKALTKATPMKNKPGLWIWSRDSPALKDALLKSNRRLMVTIEGKGYDVRLGDGREEKNAFISFWPKKA